MASAEDEVFSKTLVFFVNGKKIEDDQVNPEWTLLFYLRNKLKLCGTKLGCGEGGCGACTVMVSKYDRRNNREIHLPVNACLAPLCSMHGLAITTTEGIGSTRNQLHPVQERIAKAHGSQCGFCTPGIVMSMYTLLRQNSKPKMKDIEEAFQGNLCRCTGYRSIIEGYKTFTEEWETWQNGSSTISNGNNGGCVMGGKCCKLDTNSFASQIKNDEKICNKLNQKDSHMDVKAMPFNVKEFTPYHSTQEPIFPPELKLSDKYDKQFLKIEGLAITWYRPPTLHSLLKLKSDHPDAKIVVGNSEVGVEMKFKDMFYPVLIHPSHIEELNQLTVIETGVKIGASASIYDIDCFLKEQIQKHPEYKTKIYQELVQMFQWFAGKQIRSVGSLGGNIMTGSPISDIIPILLAAQVKLEVLKGRKTEMISLDDNFFIGYRKSCLDPTDILLAIHIPFSSSKQYIKAYKQAKRKEDDIAIVNLAVNVNFEDDSCLIISDIHLGIGGMSFKTISAPNTESRMKTRKWNRETLELASNCLMDEFSLQADAPGGMVKYRESLVLSLFFRAFLAISSKLPDFKLSDEENSAILEITNPEYKSSQYFQVYPNAEKSNDTLQRPLVHLSAFKQATGEAIYVDDMPKFDDELYLAFVCSTRPHAKIFSIDFTDAMKIEGVVGTLTADDIPEKVNHIGTHIKDEKVFYSHKVTSEGQVLAALVAVDQITAQRAVKKVKVIYENLTPVLLTIDDAIRHDSFFDDKFNLSIEKGDVDRVFKDAKNTIEGESRIGGQKHFYLETHAFIAVPLGEDSEMDIYATSQHPTEIQKTIAQILGVSQHKINVKVKRLGGGFGGKEWKATMTSIPIAIAAKKFNRPVRCMLDRNEDMFMHGGRNPFYVKYMAAFDDDGKILAADYEVYLNAGYSVDFSFFVLERAMTHLENAFNIQTIRGRGFLCRTNIQSNTAMRGFGAPQIGFAITSMVDDIANYLRKDISEISRINLYKEGDSTYYGQKLENCTIEKCWEECIKLSNYSERRKKITKFNKKNCYKKRGLAIVPNKHGIGIPEVFMNQGAALINVYADGSVLLHHGGVEMGQGLHTKMIQIVTRVLDIPVDRIFTSHTNTAIVPNTFETAASLGSDWNGGAVLNACQKIKARLKPFQDANPNGTWEEWVNDAHRGRVSLSATGFYKTPDINYDWVKKKGNMYNYFTYGVGCIEVEIDTLTGDHKIIRTDIVMDIGESLNPAIDIGQIEGGFMQGYGLYTLEEQLFTPKGSIITRGPGNYKIPGFGNIPGEFNVSLLKGSSNPRAVYSSKAVGEPPLFLSCAAVFAIKDAIRFARKTNGASEAFQLDCPATSERIRLACHDKLLEKVFDKTDDKVPWSLTI